MSWALYMPFFITYYSHKRPRLLKNVPMQYRFIFNVAQFFDECGNKTFALFQYCGIRNKDNALKIRISALLGRKVIGYFFLVSKSEVVLVHAHLLKPCVSYRIILMQNAHITHQMKFLWCGNSIVIMLPQNASDESIHDPWHFNLQCFNSLFF